MKHKHHDLIVAWAADTTKVVQVRDPRVANRWVDVRDPNWESDEYRFKPEPKPDLTAYYAVDDGDVFRCLSYDSRVKLRLTFDGETGALKVAEVLK